MDPYLEGHLWPDVHSGLAFVTKELLVAQLSDQYTVRTELYTVLDTEWQEDLGILYPDVEVRKSKLKEPAGIYDTAFTPPTAVTKQLSDMPNRIPSLYIRNRNNQQLITVIEYLSPVNKRSPGRSAYLEKRAKLQQSKVNLLEIDLIRRGKRVFHHPQIEAAPYAACLSRSDDSRSYFWGIQLNETLPVLPVPLLQGEDDAKLPLQQVLDTLFERSRYEREIDYEQPPPPPVI
jgi:hypothetical protein